MKRIILLLLICIVPLVSWSQDIKVVKVFYHNDPFSFNTYWDRNEGSRPGPSRFSFINSNLAVISDGESGNFIFFDSTNWSIINKFLPGGFDSPCINIGQSYFIISRSGTGGEAFVFDKRSPLAPVIKIKPTASSIWHFNVIASDKYIFTPSVGIDRLASWELDFSNGKYIRREFEDTASLLQAGLAEQLGLKKPYSNLQFPSRVYSTETTSSQIVLNDFSGYVYDKKEYEAFKLLTPGESFWCIGNDSRGLYYFMGVSPSVLYEGRDSREAALANINKQLVFAIADPWQKRIIFRILPKGVWNPPADKEYGLLGSYPFAVHPDGSIYFFDGDVATKSFILKCVVNDWWRELSFDKKQVGIVNANRVRVRKLPSLDGEVVNYLYEMEHALILEKSAKEQTIDGKTAYWYKVRMWDGREGWTFGAFLDF